MAGIEAWGMKHLAPPPILITQEHVILSFQVRIAPKCQESHGRVNNLQYYQQNSKESKCNKVQLLLGLPLELFDFCRISTIDIKLPLKGRGQRV